MKKVAYLNPENCDGIDYDRSKVKDHENAQIMTLDEFQEAFNEEEISELGLIVFFEEETEQDIIDKATHYLCDDEDATIGQQLELIRNTTLDQHDLLSNVEGVTVWSKLENSLTIEEFCSCVGI